MTATAAGKAERGRGFFSRARASVDLGYYALAVVFVTYGLIVLGGTVRATDSGTACPDWPLCHGQVVPPADVNVWIEFSHRLLASVVGFLILGLVYAIWRYHRADRPLWWAAIVITGLLALQVIVGGVTVGTETAAGVVAIHLTIALTLISLLIFVATRLLRESTDTASFEIFPALVAMGIFVLIMTGVFVSQREAGLAYPDWPLFDGQLTPSSSEAGQLHYGHRVIAGIVGLLALALFIRAILVEAAPVVLWGLTVAAVLFLAQVLVGASNVWLDLHESVRILHLALASGVWCVLAFTMAWAHHNGLRITKGNPGWQAQ
jgi:cytochrome c oxidase assembly protein subunit 15